MTFDRRRAAVAVSGACSFANLYATQPLLPLLGEHFAATPAEAGMTLTAGILSVALAAPVAGLLADGWGRKRVIVAAIFALAVPTLLAGFAGGLGEVVVWRFLQGLCLPFIFAVTVAYVGEEWEPKEAAAVTGFYIAGTIVGGFMGRLIAGFVAEAAGWRAAFFALAVLDVLMGLAVAAWLPREARFKPGSGVRAALSAMAGHLRDPRLRAAFVVGFCLLFVLVTTFTYINFRLAAPPYDFGAAALGAVFVVYLAGAAASPVAGRLAGRIGPRAVVALGGSTAICGLLITLAQPLWLIVSGLAVTTVGVFMAQSVATGYVAQTGAAARSAAVGLYVAAYYFGGGMGAVIPAGPWRWAGWPGVVALTVAAEIVIIAAAWVWWRERREA
jgi:MFS transporter, YNFM family, putative membrane transport protein